MTARTLKEGELKKLIPQLLAAYLALLALKNPDCPPIFQPNEVVLFQGDSITDGNRGRTADPNHILGHGYVFDIASLYGERYPELNLNFVNRGVSGNTVSDLAARWQTDTLDIHPSVLSVLIGVNDVLAARDNGWNLPIDRLYQTYDQLLQREKDFNPRIKFILGEPFTLDVGMVAKDPAHWHAAIHEVDLMVEKLAAKYKAPAIPFQSVFNQALKRAPADHWIWDGIHPTYSGHGLMTKAWIEAYNDFYVSPLDDPNRNSAIEPTVNTELDSYDWLHRHRAILDSQAKEKPDIVMIGDSITNFWAGNPEAARASGKQAWKDTFSDLKVLNIGFGWDRTQNVLWRLQNGELAGLNPRTVVLNIGTNNLVGDETARENSPEETAVGIETVATKIRELCPHSRLIVMGVFPRGYEPHNPLDAKIQVLNSILKTEIPKLDDVTFFDIGDQFRDSSGAASKDLFVDGTHPNEKGYEIWGKALQNAGFLKSR